jgi:hypothetical protein
VTQYKSILKSGHSFIFCYRADKYLKQAEDDVSLVLVPKTLLTVHQ